MISRGRRRMPLALSCVLLLSVCFLSSWGNVSCFHCPLNVVRTVHDVTPTLFQVSSKVSSSLRTPTGCLFARKSDNVIFDIVPTKEDKELATDDVVVTLSEKSEIIINDNISEEQTNISNDNNNMVFTIMALIFVVTSLSALDRVAMSVALVPLSQEMGYTDTMKGSISSFFSVGYGLGILPSGLLLAYASPRTAMAVGVTFWSLATIATPFAAEQSTMGLLLFVRAIVGGAESIVLPSVQRLLSNWIPADKKSLAVASVFAGFQSGTILAYVLSPVVLDLNLLDSSWRGLFYLYGGIGLLYLIPWLALAKDQPETTLPSLPQPKQAPGLKVLSSSSSADEQPPTASAWENTKEVLTSAPWKEFAQSKGVWAMLLAHSANNWGLYNNLSWSPTFYAEQYGLNVRDSAILLVVPSIAGMVGGLSAGALADAAIRKFAPGSKDDETITKVRKAFQGIALFGPALCLATLAWHVPEEPWVAQSLLTGTVGLQAFNSAGYGAANQEKAGEKWTGLLYGITSLPAVMVGTFGVYLTGQILDITHQDWSYVFGLNAFMNILGATAFVTLYDSKREFD